MILRRAENLSTEDNIRLDGKLWNIASVMVGDDGVTLRLSRTAGEKLDMTLCLDDLLELAI